ncbi:phosphoribosylformylglycinamidine cyclo-ligase [Salinicoccus halodurans]|uniref:Phosphoribosylformylglycinamidine cyclo-ligase n=1 Tax=Salinicoccus halodurans TaxID=407035 RepID=A0A0F7HJP6_9STAP|nr:phosphoribosylformylglycinamidine cyclo-ligase [Salinicoccus halodurans]AKG73634.1 phosphoribosylaminoimidazole synthetase [Salinicoccus halodurans]SFK53650.1 phosphoribosylformylglycinamidine cyclo-ligase [Salinicoccus halodurans]
MSEQYKKAGVDIEAGYEAVDRMETHVKRTMRKEVIGGLGGFGAAFDLSGLNMKAPVLVSGTDGVGTKLKLAIDHNRHNTIGIDAVAMCVNDILTTGAEPLYFLDYIAVNKVIPEMVAGIVDGVSEGCVQAGCALIGGETAEMGEMYGKGEYDIAGFAVGAVEKTAYIDGSDVKAGDRIIGLPSSGIHSNGYSLVRKLLLDNAVDVNKDLDGRPIIDQLLEPTRIYVKSVRSLMEKVDVKAMSHITGGGFIENIPRTLPDHLGADIEAGGIEVPRIISWLMELGNIDPQEAYNVFNMGIGFIIAVDEADVEAAVRALEDAGEAPEVIGTVTEESGLRIHGR